MSETQENETNYLYIIPEDLFDDPKFTKNDLKIYARIKLLKYGLKTSYGNFAKIIGVNEKAIKRAVPKLLKAGWLRKDNNSIKVNLQRDKIETIKPLNSSVERDKIETLAGTKMSPLIVQDNNIKEIHPKTSEPLEGVKLKDGSISEVILLTKANKRRIVELYQDEFDMGIYKQALHKAFDILENHIYNNRKGKKFDRTFLVLKSWVLTAVKENFRKEGKLK